MLIPKSMPRGVRRKALGCRPLALESLEDRCLLSYAITDLGTLGGATSYAWDVNDAGHVAGYADTVSGASHAFLYKDGAMLDLGTLRGRTSRAFGINNQDQVVGSADLDPTTS